jgi:cytochrome P450
MARPFKFPLWVPTPAHRKLTRAKLQLDQIVYAIIRGRKGRTAGRRDLLSRMLDLNLKESEVRDEVMTLLLAGHETTANAVAWTLYLLGRNPEAQNKLREELNAKVAGEIPTLEELKSLSYCTMVFEEAMRLFPPAAIIGREALQDDQIAGYRIPAGAAVELCQWVTHRHPAFWQEPLRFRPERFERPHQHHPFAYFPFASGPRECVGKNLALVEGVAIIAGLAKNFTFQAVDGHDSRPLPLITLRPDPGVFLTVQPTCH